MTIRRIDLSSLEAQRAWDARAVDAPGGDVHQGSAWLTYRASLGREAIALEIDDAPLGILLNRAPLFGLPKGHAPRGPLAPWGATVAQAVAAAERIQRAAMTCVGEIGAASAASVAVLLAFKNARGKSRLLSALPKLLAGSGAATLRVAAAQFAVQCVPHGCAADMVRDTGTVPLWAG